MRGRTILLIEGDIKARNHIASALRSDGHELAVASKPSTVSDLMREENREFSLVLLDLTLIGLGGIETLRELRLANPQVPILVFGGNGSFDCVEWALQNGATAALSQPFTREQLTGAIRSLLAGPQSWESNEEAPFSESFLCKNGRMRAILYSLPQIAISDVPVVLRGESGVGKEVVAREIHRLSARRSKPFVKINCVALPSELLESELFGYERGAFTGAIRNAPGKFEAADTGTLLLDEVGDMDFKLQAKLLHVLQDSQFQRLGSCEVVKVDVRVLAATHCNLEQAIRESRFREDLYYRLNVLEIRIPPLREREDEILPLARRFIRKHMLPGTSAPEITPVLERALLAHSWPGNVRELENVIRRYLVFPYPEMIVKELEEREGSGVVMPFAEPVSRMALGTPSANQAGRERPFEKRTIQRRSTPALDHFSARRMDEERRVIIDALVEAKWNRVRAAELLNVDYRKLLYRIRKLGISPSRATPRKVGSETSGDDRRNEATTGL